MALTKTETATIQNCIDRLRCTPVLHKGEYIQKETEEVRAALTGDAKLFLETWVIGALELLIKERGRDPKLAEKLSSR